MAVIASDNFNGTHDQSLTDYSASWTMVQHAMVLRDIAPSGVGVRSNTSGQFAVAYWNADAFPNDQYAQVALGQNTGSSNNFGPTVRMATAAWTGYWFEITASRCRVRRIVAGSGAYITDEIINRVGETETAYSAGTVFRIEVEGTTITTFINDVQSQQVTDSNIASGYAGMTGYNNSNNLWDDWEAGSLAAIRPAGQLVTTKYHDIAS